MAISRREFFGGILSAAGAAVARKAVGSHVGEPLLRFGYASDTHLTTSDDPQDLGRVFGWFHSRNVDAVVLSGDITEGGFDAEIDRLLEIWGNAFPDDCASDGRRVEKFWVWGNHDYKDASYMRSLPPERKVEDLKVSMFSHKDESWRKITGEAFQGEVFHKKIKGFSFVGAHWKHENETIEYFRSHASEIDTSKFFVYVQHPHVPGTVYYPGRAEHSRLRATLSQYSNCFCLSGHGHESAAYESALWQGEFTALGGSSTKSVGTLKGRENSAWASWCKTPEPITPSIPMGNGRHAMIISVYANELVIERHEFRNDEPLGGEWVLPLPLETHPESPIVIASNAKVPQFAYGAKIKISRGIMRMRKNAKGECYRVSFPSALATKGNGRVTDYLVAVRKPDSGTPLLSRMVSQPKMTLAERRLESGDKIYCLIKAEDLKDMQDLEVTVTPMNAAGKGGRPLVGKLQS